MNFKKQFFVNRNTFSPTLAMDFSSIVRECRGDKCHQMRGIEHYFFLRLRGKYMYACNIKASTASSLELSESQVNSFQQMFFPYPWSLALKWRYLVRMFHSKWFVDILEGPPSTARSEYNDETTTDLYINKYSVTPANVNACDWNEFSWRAREKLCNILRKGRNKAAIVKGTWVLFRVKMNKECSQIQFLLSRNV